jgi:hypothetical protein
MHLFKIVYVLLCLRVLSGFPLFEQVFCLFRAALIVAGSPVLWFGRFFTHGGNVINNFNQFIFKRVP